ncbi:hypothetical protein [Moorena sp. SIO3I8]|nr:hypothetical protein [Moorena sp. SIO3I8]
MSAFIAAGIILPISRSSRLPTPDSRFPTPDSRFPIPCCLKNL